MFTPHSFSVALVMMVTSTVCWGSWANTYKGTRGYRFELFYWDYALGIFLTSLALAFTLGSVHHDATSFLANVRAADPSNIGHALLGGVIFNLANLLLVAAIEIAGLAIAFPLTIGIALVTGVLLSYSLQPKGSAPLLAAGVLCALIAVIMDGRAYACLVRGEKSVSRKGVIICVVGGLLMGSFAPFVTRALTTGNALGPYSIAVFFTLGALLSCFLFNIYLMKNPLAGPPVNFGQYFNEPARGHLLGLAGGLIWALGTNFNFIAASFTGVAISYAIGQAAPMVAALWGVLVWKEFAGAGTKAKTYLALMFVFYVVALVLLSTAYTSA